MLLKCAPPEGSVYKLPVFIHSIHFSIQTGLIACLFVDLIAMLPYQVLLQPMLEVLL